MQSTFQHIQWKKDSLLLLDQRKLPTEETYFKCQSLDDVCFSIKDMVVRGAPAIGIVAAFGVVLGVREGLSVESVCLALSKTRPTAVNLFWALKRMKAFSSLDLLEKEALTIFREDQEMNLKIGKLGAALIKEKSTVLTHCNAGALATGGYGTALGVIRSAYQEGKIKEVYADETRPLLQGARLTAWELSKDDIPVCVITDNMAGSFMRKGKIDAIITGADRITKNGDVINKIGTYSLAVLAQFHKIPFYVAAPTSTLDLNLEQGGEVCIEERSAAEVESMGGIRTVPKGVLVKNPAFDVTPSKLVSAIILESGVYRFPYKFSK